MKATELSAKVTGEERPSQPPKKQAIKYSLDPAKAFSKDYEKTYTVAASTLKLRKGAGTTKQVLKTLPRGSEVNCHGYYTLYNGTIWLLVVTTDGDTGFCSKKCLK